MARMKNPQANLLGSEMVEGIVENDEETVPENVIASVFERPKGNEFSKETTAEGSENLKKALSRFSDIPRFDFVRENSEVMRNARHYFFGLFPCVNRKSIAISKYVTLMGRSKLTNNDPETGELNSIPQIGMVLELDDEQVMDALNRIKKKGLQFAGSLVSPNVVETKETSPNHYDMDRFTYPLGMFCYFESIEYLNKHYKGGEMGWRNKNAVMRPLISRKSIPENFTGQKTPDMGDGWTGFWDVQGRKATDLFGEKGMLII